MMGPGQTRCCHFLGCLGFNPYYHVKHQLALVWDWAKPRIFTEGGVKVWSHKVGSTGSYHCGKMETTASGAGGEHREDSQQNVASLRFWGHR